MPSHLAPCWSLARVHTTLQGCPQLVQSAPHEGGNGEGEHPPGGGPQLERELACYLLELTYDASPLVRAQVALGLARISLSHPLLFQACPPRLCAWYHLPLAALLLPQTRPSKLSCWWIICSGSS